MSRNFKWGDSEMRNHCGLSPQGVQGAGAPARCRRWACLLQNRCGCPSTEALIGVQTSDCRIWRDRDQASANPRGRAEPSGGDPGIPWLLSQGVSWGLQLQGPWRCLKQP